MSGSERVSPMNQAAQAASESRLRLVTIPAVELRTLDHEHQPRLMLEHRPAEPVLGTTAAEAGEQALLLLQVAGRDDAAEPLERPLPQPRVPGGIRFKVNEQHPRAGERTGHARMSPEVTGMAGSTSSRNCSS